MITDDQAVFERIVLELRLLGGPLNDDCALHLVDEGLAKYLAFPKPIHHLLDAFHEEALAEAEKLKGPFEDLIETITAISAQSPAMGERVEGLDEWKS